MLHLHRAYPNFSLRIALKIPIDNPSRPRTVSNIMLLLALPTSCLIPLFSRCRNSELFWSTQLSIEYSLTAPANPSICTYSVLHSCVTIDALICYRHLQPLTLTHAEFKSLWKSAMTINYSSSYKISLPPLVIRRLIRHIRCLYNPKLIPICALLVILRDSPF